MENATKALLIAAAVLIAIILVAAGVLLIRNIGDTDEQAKEVGNLISEATGNASHIAIGASKGVIISKSKFNSFINDFSKKYSTTDDIMRAILEGQNVKLSNQIQVIGYVYKNNGINLRNEMIADIEGMQGWLDNFDSSNQENNRKYFDAKIAWIETKAKDGKTLEKLDDPLNDEVRLEELKKVYSDHVKNATEDDFNSKRKWTSWSFGYDDWGYINKAVYIAGINF